MMKEVEEKINLWGLELKTTDIGLDGIERALGKDKLRELREDLGSDIKDSLESDVNDFSSLFDLLSSRLRGDRLVINDAVHVREGIQHARLLVVDDEAEGVGQGRVAEVGRKQLSDLLDERKTCGLSLVRDLLEETHDLVCHAPRGGVGPVEDGRGVGHRFASVCLSLREKKEKEKRGEGLTK